MHVTQCLNPHHIVNPYTKENMCVPCGHCEYCVNTHSGLWVQRLSQEMQCWPYCVFFTLTYDEEHVPRMSFDRDTLSLVDLYNGYTIDVSDTLDVASRKYLYKRRSLPVLSKQDVQKFVKRLRYYIHELHKKNPNVETDEIIRYYICGEYGETTLRPHYHGLFFFRSPLTAKEFQVLLSESWKFGNTNWSYAKQNAPQYVAQYVNCAGNLPKVYDHKELRQFTLFSKCPPLGSLVIPTEEIFEIWRNGVTERNFFDARKKKFVALPLWRCIQDRLFPKCKGFGQLSHFDRISMYGVSKFFPADTFDEFKASFECNAQKLINSDLGLNPPSSARSYINLYFDNLDSKNDGVLKLAWRLSKRVLAQCAVFNCSLDYYVGRIENYYNNRDLYRLKQQYQFEQDFSRIYGPCSLIYLDPVFVSRKFQQSNLFDLSERDRLIFESFGVDPLRFINDYDYRRNLDIFAHPEYRDMVSLHKSIFKKNRKTKRKNDYLLAHPELNFF